MSKVLVSGGAGFLGSNLVKRLVDDAREVVVADDLSRGNINNLIDLDCKPLPDVLSGDLKNYDVALEAVEGCDTVFHLAARVGSVAFLHGCPELELEAFQQNTLIDTNVFRACLEHSVKNIVYASSVSVYPIHWQMLGNAVFGEDASLGDPDGGYGHAKVQGEYQLSLMKDCKVGVARIFSVYGPCMDLKKSVQAVGALCKKAVEYPSRPFKVWGSGEQTRDYLYVDDCVDALLLLEKTGGTVNVGSGVATSLDDVARRIIRLSGKQIWLRHDLKKPVGAFGRTAKVDRLKALGWKQKTSLDNGLAKTFEWVERRLKEEVKG
jgi:GDP-D-mannose 3',5'-epimerase